MMKEDSIRISLSPGVVISPELHSQFIEHLGSCIYDGIWVGKDSDIPNIEGFRKDVLLALQKIAPPVVRWPGGCFADTYHWKDGVGENRPIIYNGNFGTYQTEDNSFGTDEFMRLCELIDAKPWLNINMLSGTVREAADWAEYCNREEPTALSDLRRKNGHDKPYQVRLWGIGNEVWAGGGNMTPEGYTDAYRRYASAMPQFVKMTPQGRESLPQTYILSGPDGNKPKERVRWTKDLFTALSRYRQPSIGAIDLHFYNWNITGSDDVDRFDEKDWYRVLNGALEIGDVIDEQYTLIQQGLSDFPESEVPWFPNPAPKCDLYIGEWGNWHGSAFAARPALWQQCSMRDALTSALTLDIFHQKADKVKLACCAQTVNVLNSLMLTDGDKTVLTPNYYIYQMYMVHRGGNVLTLENDSQPVADGLTGVMAFASRSGDVIHLNIVCPDYQEGHSVTVSFPEEVFCNGGETLCSEHPTDCNTFENPDKIHPTDNSSARLTENGWVITVPPASVSVFHFQLASHE